MFNSLRWTLQLWHAGLLAVVLAGFGTAAYYGISNARYQKLDADLASSAQVLAAGLRTPPPNRFGGRGGGGGGGGGGGFQPWRQQQDQQPPPDGGPGGGPDGRMFDRGPGPGTQPSFFGQGQDRGPDHGRGPGPDGGPNRGQNFGQNFGQTSIPDNLAQQYSDGSAGSMYFVVFDFDHNVVLTSRPEKDVPDPGHLAWQNFGPPDPRPPLFRSRGDYREAYVYGHGGDTILVGRSILADQSELRRQAYRLGGVGAAVLVIGLAGGWALSLRAVRPIHTITAVAQEISATNLSRRIDAAGTQSELGTLAAVLNNTFERLESAFSQQVRFTADASHELRTPLSVIHTHAQLALSRPRTAEEYRKAIETCLRASGRMKELVDSLLILAKADAGRLTLDRRPMDLAQVAEDCAAMLAPLAADKGVTIETHLQATPLNADPTRLAQVATNLVTNAIRYNHPAGKVTVSVRAEGQEAILSVADTGVGIDAEHQSHLFERFYRVDAARNREDGGSGLGLAICKSIVESHGGSIACTSKPGEGTVFTVRIRNLI